MSDNVVSMLVKRRSVADDGPTLKQHWAWSVVDQFSTSVVLGHLYAHNMLNWARRTSWGWWDEWDDTVVQTHDSKFEPWRSETEHGHGHGGSPQYWNFTSELGKKSHPGSVCKSHQTYQWVLNPHVHVQWSISEAISNLDLSLKENIVIEQLFSSQA